MQKIIAQFPVEGIPLSCTPIKSGHINDTYLVTTDTGSRYILQRINRYVFPNIDALIHNMSAISSFLQKKQNQEMAMICYMSGKNGNTFYEDDQGGCWRIYRFVDNSICIQRPESCEDFQECARAFGRFQYVLSEFPVRELQETIVHFHDTPNRYAQLRVAVEKNSEDRCRYAEPEIQFIFSRESLACRMQSLIDQKKLPIRAAHNDTKINNVLFDQDTRKAICVIDLDTIMPGLAAFDFGDAIRFGASTAEEDEQDLSRVSLDLNLYRAFVHGYLNECPIFTSEEKDTFALGAITMTLECGMRFLTDYLKGDRYFSIDYPEQNLIRARAQFQLARDMEKKITLMQSIVEEESESIENGISGR